MIETVSDCPAVTRIFVRLSVHVHAPQLLIRLYVRVVMSLFVTVNCWTYCVAGCGATTAAPSDCPVGTAAIGEFTVTLNVEEAWATFASPSSVTVPGPERLE